MADDFRRCTTKRQPFRIRREFIAGLCLAAVTILAYGPVTGFDFVDFDDQLYVRENPMVQMGLTCETLGWAFSEATLITGYWVPLTWISFLVDYTFYGMAAGGYHLTNLLLHLANVLLLFAVLRRMTGAVWRSGLVAVLFAVHPLHVESVAWITERKDVLSTLFWLLTMNAYAGYARRPGPGGYALVAGLFLLGLMAKPMLVTLPVVLLLLDHWPLGRGDTGGGGSKGFDSGRWLVIEKLPLMAIALAAGIAALFTQKLGGAIVPMTEISATVRLANTPVAYATYLGKMLWPAGLAALYPHPGELGMLRPAAATLLLAALTLGAFRWRKQAPFIAVGWLWYLITLAPVSGLVVIGPHVVADRYAYVPLIGLYIALAWSLPAVPLARSSGAKAAAVLVVLVLVSTLVALTRQQATHWSDSMHLFQRMLDVTRDNYSGHTGLGEALARQGRHREAEVQYQKAIAINPDFALAHFNYGLTLLATNRLAEARDRFQRAVNLSGKDARYRLNLGVAFALEGDMDAAMACFQRASQLDPGLKSVRANMANVRRIRGDRPGGARYRKDQLWLGGQPEK